VTKKAMLLIGFGVAGVAAIALMATSANATEEPDEELPDEDEGPIEEAGRVVLDEIETASPGIPQPTPDEDEDADQGLPLPLPGGRPIEDVIREGVKKGEEILEKAKDRVIVDDGETPTPDEDEDVVLPELPGVPPEVVEKIPEELRRIPLPDVGPGVPLEPPDLSPGEGVPVPPPAPLDRTTETMVRTLLAKEARPDWKAEEATVRAWQRLRGLTADGKFGPGSARLLAQETGLLPIVRFWPRGTFKERAVPEFQTQLVDLAAAAEEPRRTHLLAAAEREQGQAFGTPPKPILVRIAL
jgi:hypothetical protein